MSGIILKAIIITWDGFRYVREVDEQELDEAEKGGYLINLNDEVYPVIDFQKHYREDENARNHVKLCNKLELNNF